MAQFRPDIASGDDPPRDQTEYDTHEKPDHLLWHDEVSFLEFQRLTAAGGGDRGLPVAEGRGTKVVGDGVLAPPHLRVGRERRQRPEPTPPFAGIAVHTEPRSEWIEHAPHNSRKQLPKI